jgi:hypothetical protein
MFFWFSSQPPFPKKGQTTPSGNLAYNMFSEQRITILQMVVPVMILLF